MKLSGNISLKSFNTFNIDVRARFYAGISDPEDILPFLSSLDSDHKPILILGGGSNILFTKDFPGTVVRIATHGIKILKEDSETVIIRAEAGENWDELVKYTVDKGWSGLENLSMIPGNAGTAPVQNIGAYGVELKDVLFELEAINLLTLKIQKFTREECLFDYRDSLFKNKQYLIVNISLRLLKNPVLRLDYAPLKNELTSLQIKNPTISDIREAVIRIRNRKLPDPARIGNAGSFFKNPVITQEHLEQIRFEHPDVVYFPFNDQFKLAAAWLIEQCGWKNRRQGDAGVYPGHSLIIVNYGSASGKDILDLSNQIKTSVYEKFGVSLEPEVNII